MGRLQSSRRTCTTFTRLCFSLTDATFTELQLNLNATQDDGFVTFTVTFLMGFTAYTETFELAASGQNRFTIEAGAGVLITEACLDSTVTLNNARQFRVGGAAAIQQVPEGGATLIFLGVSLGAIGFVRRKLRKHSPAA